MASDASQGDQLIGMVLLKEVAEPILNHVDPTDIEVGLAAVGL